MATIPVPLLTKALQGLIDATSNMIQSSKIQNLDGTIKKFAVASAVTSAAAGLVPGFSGTLAALAQTGMIWTLYLKINEELGVSIKKETLKFIASAIATNLLTNAGAIILSVIASSILSFIPGGAVVICASMGYVIIYACAILYLQLLTKVMKAKGSIDIKNNDETVQIIKDVVKDAKIKDIINEGKENFKTVDLDKERKNPKCPVCNGDIVVGQPYCPNCGSCLSKAD